LIENYGAGKHRSATISNNQVAFCKRAIAYVKANIPPSQAGEKSLTLALECTSFIDDLNIFYAVNEPQGLVFIEDHHREAESVSIEALGEIGLQNLHSLFRQELEVKKMGAVYGIFVDGNFEASGLLLDELWDQQLRCYVSNSFVVAAPSRDVLAFCDSESTEGINALQKIIRRVHAESENPNHLLSQNLYQRVDGKWVTLNLAQVHPKKQTNDQLQKTSGKCR